MRMTLGGRSPDLQADAAPSRPCMAPKITGASHGRDPEQAEARAGERRCPGSTARAGRTPPTAGRGRPAPGSATRERRETGRRRRARSAPMISAVEPIELAPVVPDEDARQRCHAVPEPEHQRRSRSERRQLGRSPPRAIAVRKLSRLRVNPRMRRLPTTVVGELLVEDFGSAICHVLADVADHHRLLRSSPAARRRTARCPWRGPEHLGQEPLGPAAPAGRRDDVLLPVDAVRRRAAVVAAAALELPQQLTAVGVPAR